MHTEFTETLDEAIGIEGQIAEKEQQEVRLSFRDEYSILLFKDKNEIANFSLRQIERKKNNAKLGTYILGCCCFPK